MNKTIEKIECSLCSEEIDGEKLRDNTDEFKKLDAMYEGMNELHICNVCMRARKVEIAEEMLKPFVESVSRWTNGGNDYDGIILEALFNQFHRQHRYLQGTFMQFIHKFLEKYGIGSEDPRFEDGRNAWALKWASRAAIADETGNLVERLAKLDTTSPYFEDSAKDRVSDAAKIFEFQKMRKKRLSSD